MAQKIERARRCLTRSTLFAAGFVIALACGSVAQGGDGAVPTTGDRSSSPTVVFVCEHGVAKSLVAAALFNRMAEQRGLSVRAISRAADPKALATKVPPRLVQNMSGDGFDVVAFRPQALAPADAAGAARLVILGYDGALEAAANAAVERWDDIAPASLEYDSAKKALVAHIDILLGRFDRSSQGAAMEK